MPVLYPSDSQLNARLMRHANLKSVIQRKYVVTTTDSKHTYSVAKNHLAGHLFSKLFKSKTNLSPLEFRATYN